MSDTDRPTFKPPTITGISPDTIPEGGDPKLLSVTGGVFGMTDVVQVEGHDVTTTFLSPGRLEFTIDPVSAEVTPQVTVTTPLGLVSNSWPINFVAIVAAEEAPPPKGGASGGRKRAS